MAIVLRETRGRLHPPRRRRKKTKRVAATTTRTEIITIVVVIALCFLTALYIAKFHHKQSFAVDWYARRQRRQNPSERIIIFKPPPAESEQGIGNAMNGLLAAHMLGEEFGRTVHVSKDWNDFLFSFDSIKSKPLAAPKSSSTLWLINFSKHPMNECYIRSVLSSNHPVVVVIANSYPRWPMPKSWDLNFSDFYRPKSALCDELSWTDVACYSRPYSSRDRPWPTVVHLRQGDDPERDVREGLDEATLAALNRQVSQAYLLTNKVGLYDRFPNWDHPSWQHLRHSAKKEISWDENRSFRGGDSTEQQLLQAWSDWYTILHAWTVYHSLSDFSSSAVRWSHSVEKSYTIHGVDRSGNLQVKLDDVASGTTVHRLVDRLDAELANCREISKNNLIGGIGGVLDLDDEYNDDNAAQPGH